MAIHFRQTEEVTSAEMLSRLIALCVLCAVIITMHVVYFLVSGSRVVHWELGYPMWVGDRTFDSFGECTIMRGSGSVR